MPDPQVKANEPALPFEVKDRVKLVAFHHTHSEALKSWLGKAGQVEAINRAETLCEPEYLVVFPNVYARFWIKARYLEKANA